MRVIKENSNRYRKMNKGLFGDPSGKIRTFAIISPENPLGWKDSTEEEFRKKFNKWLDNPGRYNKEAKRVLTTDELLHVIKDAGDKAIGYSGAQYTPLLGSYGSEERSYMIFNIPLVDAKKIARNYGQESFFYGKVYPDYSHIAYYETNDACKTYKLVEVSDVVSDEEMATDYFSKFGRKWRINMKTFGDDVSPIENEKEFEESFDENSTFMSRAHHRRRSREQRSLTESSLSKLYSYMKEYDVACISADKYLPDRNEYKTQKEYELKFKERLGKYKKLDAKALLISLKSIGTVLSIKGFYQYSKTSTPSKEKSFASVNTNNLSDFKERIMGYAVEAKQNSFYYVEAGTFEGYWIYTGIDLAEPDEIDKNHKKWDTDYRGPVHFGTYATSDDGTGYSLINGRPFSSYTKEPSTEVKRNVERVRTRNTKNNITVIDESADTDSYVVGNSITKEQGSYVTKVKNYINNM